MTVRSIVPGMPKILTNMIVKKFKPIWKLKRPPIKFISSISIIPIKEFKKSLPITLSGSMNILQSTNIIQSAEI